MNLYDYLQSNEPYFWKWEEDGDIIEIPHGSTIAYTNQVKEIMDHIAEQGLPSFGCLLLVIIATNKAPDNSLLQIKDMLGNELIDTQQFSAENRNILTEAFSFLSVLNKVPQQQAVGRNKLRLIQTIFSDAHNKLSPKKSKKLVEAFNGYIDKVLLAKTNPFHQSLIARDFKTLALLNRRFPTVKSIFEKMADLPKDEIDISDAEDDLSNEVKERDFVDELIENPQTFRIGSLLKPLWAGFKIPINTTMPSQQQFGGISDLTNKGDFDKLLISEFANDDLVFMSRLANNEALYMHREMPPAVDEQQRILLLDISLMSWGTPKVLAHAAAIAISKHPRALSESRAFVIGKRYEEVHFNTPETVIDGLQLTDNGLHPAAGMDLFLKEYNESKRPEIFLIITPDALRKPAVQRVLSEYTGLFRYIVTVEADGGLSFYKLQAGNRKLLQHIKLDLQQYWRKQPEAPRKSKELSTENQYPILLAGSQNISCALMAGSDELYIISEKILFKRIALNNKGYKIMAENIAKAQKFAIGKYKNGETHFLSFNPESKSLSILNLDTKEAATIAFDRWRAQNIDFFFYDDERYLTGFYHFNNTGLYYFSLEDGKIVITDTRIDLADLRIAMTKAEEEMKRLKTTTSHATVLKNVKKISIDIYHNLVFNQHALSLHTNAILLGGETGTAEMIAHSKYDATSDSYLFPEGSSIKVHPAGMFILKSSNKALQDIYIPSVLNNKIGIATDNSFSGNEYYNPYVEKKRQLYKVSLMDAGSNKLMIIKIIREATNLSLQRSKEIVDDGKVEILKINMSHREGYYLHHKLTFNGAKATFEPMEKFDTKEMFEVLDVDRFNDTHLKPFIQNILQHAGTSKTQ
jgi:ribosomal protein L7/L12